jgi:hypothetical protein
MPSTPRPYVSLTQGIEHGRPGFRGSVLRRLNRHDEAIAACTRALTGPTQWQTFSMVDIARSHAAQGDVDAAAAMLEDAYLLNASAGLVQRQGRVRAVRALLPDSVAVHQLDAVMTADRSVTGRQPR